MITILVVVVLILVFWGASPAWGWGGSWRGGHPANIAWILLLFLLIFWLLGGIRV